jgi:hypothetical protein
MLYPIDSDLAHGSEVLNSLNGAIKTCIYVDPVQFGDKPKDRISQRNFKLYLT